MNHLLITGTPGVGKTMLIRECINPLREKVGGFVTLEAKGPQGEREGFEIMSLPTGEKKIFASKNMASSVKLNKYGIDLTVLERLGTSSIEKALGDEAIRVIVIDEIGAMEAESEAFRTAVMKALSGDKPVLAAIRAKNQPFSDEIKRLSNLNIVELTRANYPSVKTQVQQWLQKVIQEK